MKTTDRLLAATKEIWESYNTHPFVMGIQNGTLKKEKFRYYISCAYSYEVIAKKMVANAPDSVNDSFYGDWIGGYASEDYAAGNIVLLNTLNALTEHYTEPQLSHLVDVFVACSRYELAFWQMSWEMKHRV